MKPKLKLVVISYLLSAISFSAFAQGTAFTYQGRLNSSGSPVNGSYDLTFTLYTTNITGSAVAPPVTNAAVAVTNGLFTTLVDFGPGVFTGASNWLAIAVRTNATGSFSTLAPRQQVTPAPYALFANTANNVSGTVPASQISGAVASANLSGNYGNAVTFSNPGDSFTGNGGGLTNLNASKLTGGTIADALLSANVALLNANQTFTGSNVFSGLNASFAVSGTGPISTGLFTGLGLQFYNGSGEGAIMSSVNDANASLTFYTKPGPGYPVAKQMKIDRYGVVMIDQQNVNNGVLNDGTTNGVGLVFGGNSGEGIASQRTPGINQFGLDFYTGRTHQMSILNNGNIGMGVTNPSTALQVSGTVTATAFAGDGSLLVKLNASQLNGGTVPNSVLSGFQGNYNTISGGQNNIVYSNNQFETIGGGYNNSIQTNAYESGIGGGDSNSIGSNSDHSYIGGGWHSLIWNNSPDSMIGGGFENSILAYSGESVIGGGESNTIQTNANHSYIGGGLLNSISGRWDTIGGGDSNSIRSNSDHSYIGGGWDNSIWNNSPESMIGGGAGNYILAYSGESMIGGGESNTIQTNSDHSYIGGGQNNQILTNSFFSIIGGGYLNSINGRWDTIGGGYGNYVGAFVATVSGGYSNSAAGISSVVPGGQNNQANGNISFAAGSMAQANNNNAFVWSDGTVATASAADTSVTFRASGGYRFFTGTNSVGAQLLAGDTSWTTISDRNQKKNFQPVDTAKVLDKLAAIPIQQWNYKWEKDSTVPNIGPMAQDFKHAFYPGRDDKGISTLEFDGVELAAIQGLNQKLEAQNAELKQLNQSLEKRLDKLERLLERQTASP